MDWRSRIKDRAFWNRVLLWLLLLSIAPFAIEILFLADIVGIELAMAFFAYYLKDMGLIWQARMQTFRAGVGAGFRCITSHAIGQPRFLLQHCAMSLTYFVLSGSLIWALLVWYPIVMMGGSLPVTGY